ncbi:MAG TPA: DNA polymerase I [Candidatus Aquicultor sp.]
MKKKIILIDGNSLVYRAFFALPTTLTNSKGQVTNAAYGFTSMLIKLLKDEKPDVVIAAFDRAAPTFRHEEFEEYKAHRAPAPNELISQFPVVKSILKALNIPIFEMDGFEADDILATLASRAEAEDDTVFVVTGDRDAFQLVDDHIKIMTTRKGISDIVVYDREKVEEKYGVTPEQVVDYLALKGDPSDNIPGVPGIGEKTAAKLIQQYGNLENILDNLDSIENKRWREMLSEHIDEARLSKRLATMERDVPIEVNYDECLLGNWNEEEIRAVFSDLEFFSLLDRFLKQVNKGIKGAVCGNTGSSADSRGIPEIEVKSSVQLASEPVDITNQAALDKLTAELDVATSFAVSILTSGTGNIDKRIEAFAVAVDDKAYVITRNESAGNEGRLFDLEPQNESGIALDHALSTLKPYLENRAVTKIAHDVKTLLLTFWNEGIKPEGFSFDTMIAAYLLNPERSDYPIAELAAIHLGASIPDDDIRARFAHEAIASYKLKDKLEEQLKEKRQIKLFEEVEMPLVPVLATMEHQGVGLDIDYLEDLAKEVDLFLENIENEIYSLAEQEFNINSPQQLGFILFEKLGLPKSKKTKTGYSTDANVLNRLLTVHPIVEKIIAYRELAKLKSTYIDALPKIISPDDGRLHTSFNQTVTTTGRLSSSNPNLQNIPVRTELGQRIREAFIPTNRGDVFLSADYSQIELRLLAHYSGEPVLIKAFQEDRDIHEATAVEVFGVQPEQVTSQMRRIAKVVNFGVLYGMSPFGLSERLGMSVGDARKFISRYFERLPKVEEFIQKTIAEASKCGYVETLLGRRRYIPELKSTNNNLRSLGERFAVNAPLQGTAADIIKLAMVRIDKQLAEQELQTKMVLQVHDELIFEVPENERERAEKLIRLLMENAYPLDVKLKIDVAMGINWKNAK